MAPPFSLLATLYVDGRKKPERKIIVWLDPASDDFNQPDGLVQFKSRLVQGRDGALEEKAWVFKEVGIETVFNKIALRDSDRSAKPEDLIVDAMNASDLNHERFEGIEDRGKVGQIVVELERITVGKPFYQKRWRPRHREGDDEDVSMGGIDYDVAHKTG